eukprot:2458091-Prymnesium_polylepis.1
MITRIIAYAPIPSGRAVGRGRLRTLRPTPSPAGPHRTPAPTRWHGRPRPRGRAPPRRSQRSVSDCGSRLSEHGGTEQRGSRRQ